MKQLNHESNFTSKEDRQKRDQSFCIHTAGDEHAVCYSAFVFTWLYPGFFKRDPGRLFDYGNSLFARLVAAFQKMVFPAHAAPVCASFFNGAVVLPDLGIAVPGLQQVRRAACNDGHPGVTEQRAQPSFLSTGF